MPLRWTIACLTLLAIAGLPAVDSPHAGQVVRDPDHPQWLLRHGTDIRPFFVGPGDPEGFLHLGSRQADGTRSGGGQSQLIQKLIDHGGNCIYMQAVRSHGGDGNADENPFIDADPSRGIDHDILDQWEGWFAQMDAADILIYLFLYDDGARPFGTSSSVIEAEEAFIQAIVDRFEHHRNLIFLVGEEANEAYSGTRVRNIAARIAAHDDHGHLIGSHDHSKTNFPHWAEGSSLSHYSMQYNVSDLASVHAGAIEARQLAESAGSSGDGYLVIYSENTKQRGNDTSSVRNNIWAAAMGGVMSMRLGMDIANTSTGALGACRILQDFMEDSDFYTMRNHDELAHAGTQWVLADPGRSYIAYAASLSGAMGLASMTAGTYDLRWLDVVDGERVEQQGISVGAGDQSFLPPAAIGSHCALWIRRGVGGDPAGRLRFAQASRSVDEAAGTLTLSVERVDGDSGAATVAWQTVDGSASAGSDFVGTSGSLSWSDGDQTDQQLIITITDDASSEGDESFSVVLSDASGADLGSPSSCSVTISDDDTVNQAPVALDQSVIAQQDSALAIILQIDDPDGPGPTTYQIIDGPQNGSLSGSNNDRTYTPAAGFSGTDSFTWEANDGLADSNTATVSIIVNAPPQIGGIAVDAEPVTGADAELSATVSDDQPLTGLSYQWSTVSLPAGAAEVVFSAAAATTTATFTAAGSYVLRLQVDDAQGGSNSTDRTIEVDQTPSQLDIHP